MSARVAVVIAAAAALGGQEPAGAAHVCARQSGQDQLRPKDYPAVPAIAETLPGVYADTWMGVAAPPGTPKEIAKRISDAIRQGLRAPEMRARILGLVEARDVCPM
jgi:tripartite-type tricarboxylate transporter receptor subunit TctC